MSVEVTNETIWDIDAKAFSDLGLWVMDQMRVSTQSDLTILFVDPDPIAELHERWMSLEGPTDVMSFPMDELRPGDGKTTMEGVLGDLVICPWVAAQQAAAAGHSTMQEMMLLTGHIAEGRGRRACRIRRVARRRTADNGMTRLFPSPFGGNAVTGAEHMNSNEGFLCR